MLLLEPLRLFFIANSPEDVKFNFFNQVKNKNYIHSC